eukprot:119734_1
MQMDCVWQSNLEQKNCAAVAKWSKLQLCVGISAPPASTFRKYRYICDDKNNILADRSMSDARAQLKIEKQKTGKVDAQSDTSWSKKGFNANGSQHSMFGKFQEYDPRTGKNSKV